MQWWKLIVWQPKKLILKSQLIDLLTRCFSFDFSHYKIPFWNASKTIISISHCWSYGEWKRYWDSMFRHENCIVMSMTLHSSHQIYKQTECRMYTTDDDVSGVCLYMCSVLICSPVTDTKSIFWVSVSMLFQSPNYKYE